MVVPDVVWVLVMVVVPVVVPVVRSHSLKAAVCRAKMAAFNKLASFSHPSISAINSPASEQKKPPL